MDYLIDTNVLLRIIDRTDQQHMLTRTAVRKLRLGGEQLNVTMQNFVEFWNVATRPINKNGYGLVKDVVSHRLRVLERSFTLLSDSAEVYTGWRRLVVEFDVRGIQVHDARLAATMNAYGITHILTFNTADFRRYASEGIVAVHPEQV